MGESLTIKLAETVADLQGVDATELEYTLHDYVDTDALRLLANQGRGSWRLSFELPDHDVTVRSDGTILVDAVRTATW
ncbi:MAG: HalOD1 output domain-containing protein [Haloferacaceae archaeon]